MHVVCIIARQSVFLFKCSRLIYTLLYERRAMFVLSLTFESIILIFVCVIVIVGHPEAVTSIWSYLHHHQREVSDPQQTKHPEAWCQFSERYYHSLQRSKFLSACETAFQLAFCIIVRYVMENLRKLNVISVTVSHQ